MDPAIEDHGLDVPDAGVFHGHDGFLPWTRLGRSWASWEVEDLEIRSAGDGAVLATFEMVAPASKTGLEVRGPDAIVYREERSASDRTRTGDLRRDRPAL